VEKAKELADRVRSSGREQLLPAMTPIERRIVHLALQEDADVTTESRGDGFYKRVAVVMRNAAE
jgi:spoIIIJ-associated protein